MNNVVLIGRLTRHPEMRYTQNSQLPVAHFTIAVNRQKQEGADFIRITVFGKQAENCDRYLDKGSQVAVQGRIQTGSYKNKEGQTVYTTDVVANNVEFLGRKSEERSGMSSPAGAEEQAMEMDLPSGFSQELDDFDEDFPL